MDLWRSSVASVSNGRYLDVLRSKTIEPKYCEMRTNGALTRAEGAGMAFSPHPRFAAPGTSYECRRQAEATALSRVRQGFAPGRYPSLFPTRARPVPSFRESSAGCRHPNSWAGDRKVFLQA